MPVQVYVHGSCSLFMAQFMVHVSSHSSSSGSGSCFIVHMVHGSVHGSGPGSWSIFMVHGSFFQSMVHGSWFST